MFALIKKGLAMLLNEDSFFRNKLKTEQDLFVYIKNRIDKISNYSLLLGSGASVTSGIKTGQDLVHIWRQELYVQNGGKSDSYSIEQARERLLEVYGRDYNPEREYSSLFKLKYDLPSQRRNFVEKEMSGATLSIGYRYLANLVGANYFNTIFTTNFDQLVELALLQADLKLNPIVCSHDASIASIPVVSNRPKVIKLHGDFLFDDIKTTLQETARLERNMENKFEEFLKNFGLVVIGYSGQDDSIMDILERLINKDGYFDGGLYWCVRNDEEVYNNLRLSKLLRSDKAFIVKIKGFDEFMANLNDSICDEDFDKTPYKIKKEKITYEAEIESMKRKFPEHQIIQRDCASVEQSSVFRAIRNYDSIDAKRSREQTSSIFIKDEELRKLVGTINEALIDNNEKGVLELVTQQIENAADDFVDPLWFNRLMRLKANILHKHFRYKEAVTTVEKLLKYNEVRNIEESRSFSLLIKLLLEEGFEEKALEIIDKEIKKNEMSSYLYILSGKTKEAIYQRNNSCEYIKEEDIISDYVRAINLNPSVRANTAYIRLAKFVLRTKRNFDVLGSDEFDKTILQPFMQQCINDPDYTEILIRKMLFDVDNGFLSNNDGALLLDRIYNENVSRGDCRYKTELFNNYLYACRKLGREDMFFKRCDMSPEYVKNSLEFIQEKARFYLDVKNSLDGAINTLSEGRAFDQDNELLELLCFCSMHNNNTEFVLKNLHKLSPKSQFVFKTDIMIQENKYEELYDMSRRQFESSTRSISDYMKYSYHLLVCKKYTECMSLLEQINSKSDVLTINYELARKKCGKALRTEKIRPIYNRNVRIVKAAAAVLLDKLNEARDIMREEKNKDYLEYLESQTYPIFNDVDGIW